MALPASHSLAQIAEAPVLSVAEPVIPVALPPLGAQLARFDPAHFLEDRRARLETLDELRNTLVGAMRPAPEEIDALLDLVALHLAHRMLPEARSYLSAVPAAARLSGEGRANITPAQLGLRAAFAAALAGFDGAAPPAPAEGREAPLFQALHHSAQGDHARARPLLAQAVQALADYPAALADPAALRLFWSAVESGTWNVARVLAARLEHEGDTNPGYRYLLGRAAERGGNRVAAFDNYAAAAAGSDEWAQRARLALIDLGRGAGALSPDDARQLLVQTRALWSGGPLALGTLQRLAALEIAQQRSLAALEVLGDILRRHPDTPEAEQARVEAEAVIRSVYTRGLAGELPLADLLTAHGAIERDFGAHPAFAEALADHLAARGATALAVAEYGALRARADVQVMQEHDPDARTALQETRDRLRLKQASALFQGGQLAQAEALLEGAIPPGSPLAPEYTLLRAQVLAALERPAEVLETRMEAPGAAYLRLRAEAAYELGDWTGAQSLYEELLQPDGSGLEPRDRINLLLSVHRIGDPEALRVLIDRIAEPGDAWTAFATRLSEETPAVLPLRDLAAWQRIENADIALRQLEAAGSGGLP